jgi:hypothetical protein
MDQGSATTVEITFQPPARAHQSQHTPPVHERRLESVPASTAREMARDFAAYEAAPSEAEQHKLYTYRQVEADGSSGGEAMVALDFGEVVALQAANLQPAL